MLGRSKYRIGVDGSPEGVVLDFVCITLLLRGYFVISSPFCASILEPHLQKRTKANKSERVTLGKQIG